MKTSFHIEGMHCGSCVARIQKALSKTPGVTNSTIDLGTKTGVVEGEINPVEVAQMISKLGYQTTVEEAPKKTN